MPRQPEQDKPTPMQARYLADPYALPLMGLLVCKQAARVGMERVEVWIGSCDGGSGLENFVRVNFSWVDLVLHLDFYHPASRLEELAKSWHEGNAEQGQRTAKEWRADEAPGRGGTAGEVAVATASGKGRRRGRSTRRCWPTVEDHKQKRDYPNYLKQGRHMGSGAVESACKTVVGQGLKLAGMRWGKLGTDCVCHLRALLRNGMPFG